MWGRETVKDLTLLLFAVPVIVSLMYVPVVASGDGSWPRLLALLVLFAAMWWILRLILRRWVASGRRADGGADGTGVHAG